MILVDATTLIALGQIGKLDLLLAFDGDPVVLPTVGAEVTSEPARTNLQDFLRKERVIGTPNVPFSTEGPSENARPFVERAAETLGETEYNGDIEIVATVMIERNSDVSDLAVVSDDRRVRTVCRGLGATVTGTIGVLIRAVTEHGMSADEGRELVRRVDSAGLHMTGELREKAYRLVAEAAAENK